jgi:hypothetical protein
MSVQKSSASPMPWPRTGHTRLQGISLAFGLSVMLLLLAAGAAPAPETPAAADFKAWGLATMERIETDFLLSKRNLYAEKMKPGQPTPNTPAFMWPSGVQLTALVAAAQLDKAAYLPKMRRFIAGLDSYWQTAGPTAGYDVLPVPKPLDRYYDDNVWIVLALADAYDLSRDTAYRDRAEATFAFVLSGEDDKLGGGIYWHEQKKTSKNTCSNAPAVAAALRLNQITGKPAYLETAKRLYQWTNAHLQDSDGLYFDNVKLDGTVDKTKWSYNTALMIRSNVLFHAITKDEKYLTEAQRLAKAAESRWIKPQTGGVADGAPFAHLLCESFLALYTEDHNRHWRDVVERALVFLHDKGRDANDHYGDRWDKTLTEPSGEISLIHQASAARAFLVAAALDHLKVLANGQPDKIAIVASEIPGPKAAASVPASNPTCGAHTLIVNAYDARIHGISTLPIETQPAGSTILVLVTRGNGIDFTGKADTWKEGKATSVPLDSKDNKQITQLGVIHDYAPLWSSSGETLFAWLSAAGGPKHVFTAPMAGGDEITLAAVEIKNGGKIQDCQWNKVLSGKPNTSLSVTTTGPATLVAIWLGDHGDPANKPMTATPNNDFVVIDSELQHSWGWVQAAIATKNVAAAGKYDVTWTASPAQGAHLWLVAVQGVPKP